VSADFYGLLVRHYDEVFPLDRTWTDFVAAGLPNRRADLSVLDAGCGTGGLAIDLADRGYAVTGIDESGEMIAAANSKVRTPGNPVFERADMREFVRSAAEGSFDAAVCFGNTLVHISPDDVAEFLLGLSRVLKRDGKIFVQVLNYDRILAKRPAELPVLEADGVRLVRTYEYLADGRIGFGIRLTANGTVAGSELVLHPMRKTDLAEMLVMAGFDKVRWYGGFDGSELNDDSFLLIASAENGRRAVP
jgi:SAM-dependent methyltransferase